MAHRGDPRSRAGARACRALARHRTPGARALGYLGLFQVTRRKGETLSGRYRRNGYVLSHKIPIGPQDAFAGKPGSYSKSETLSGRYRSNGYVLSHKISIGRLDAFA